MARGGEGHTEGGVEGRGSGGGEGEQEEVEEEEEKEGLTLMLLQSVDGEGASERLSGPVAIVLG